MLRMMRVTADAPMMIFLNGLPAGEFSNEAVYLPVGEGAMIFQAFPMKESLLGVTAKLEISGEDAACCGPDALKLYLLRRGQIHVQIGFEKISREERSMPYVLRRISLGNELYATVYFDCEYCFALERSGRVVLGGAFSKKLISAEIDQRGNFLVFRGLHEAGTEFFAVAMGREPKVMLHREARKISVGEDLIEYTCEAMYGVLAGERFSLREGKVLMRELLRGDAPLPCALAVAVKEGAEEFAMKLIHPMLKREAGFSDFREFFGEFGGLYPFEERNMLGLCYEMQRNVYRVRMLRASIKDEQIANIEELEE